MKNLTLVIVTAFLFGCANSPVASKNNLNQAIKVYSDNSKSLMESGAMKRSDYYIGLFDVASKYPNAPGVGYYMESINKLICASQELESGKITQEQYDSIRREEKSKMTIHSEESRQAQQDRAARAMQAYGVYRASQPSYQPTTIPLNRTNTTCTGYGNSINCSSTSQ